METNKSQVHRAAQWDHFREFGFAYFPKVFTSDEVQIFRQESDRIQEVWARQADITGEILRWISVTGADGVPVLRAAQNIHKYSEVFGNLQAHAALIEVLSQYLGNDIVSVVNSLFWKEPGRQKTSISFHQDAVFRNPPASYRNLDTSYVQLGVAIDEHGPHNGGLQFFPGSHASGKLFELGDQSVLSGEIDADVCRQLGVTDTQIHNVELAPGDVVVWSPYTLHGSPPNTSKSLNRRFFVSGYMRASDCDFGHKITGRV